MSFIVSKSRVILFCMAALLLSACDFVVEKHVYKGVPYTDERTAGSGIMYVLAKRMPARGVNTDTLMVSEEVIEPQADIVPQSNEHDSEFLEELLQHNNDNNGENATLAPADPIVNKMLRK